MVGLAAGCWEAGRHAAAPAIPWACGAGRPSTATLPCAVVQRVPAAAVSLAQRRGWCPLPPSITAVLGPQRTAHLPQSRPHLVSVVLWNRPLDMCTAGVLPEAYRSQAAATPRTGSFVHLHLGIDGEGLPPDLGIHHLIVNRWSDFEASKESLRAREEVWEGGGGGDAYCLSRRGRGCAAGQASGRLPGEGRPRAPHVFDGKRVAGGAGRPARAAALPLAAGCTVGSGLQTLSRTDHLLSSVPAAQAPQNVCNVSIPSTLDPSLAPPGKHVVHAYTGGCPCHPLLLPPVPPAATCCHRPLAR